MSSYCAKYPGQAPRKCGVKIFFPTLCFLLVFAAVSSAGSAEPAAPGVLCPPGTGQAESGICSDGDQAILPFTQPETGILQPLPGPQGSVPSGTAVRKTGGPSFKSVKKGIVVVHFFWGRGCPHCEKEEAFLTELKRKNPALVIHDYEVWYDKKNAGLLSILLQARGMRSTGVPVTLVDRQVYFGFARQTEERIAAAIQACLSSACEDPAALTERVAGGGAFPSDQTTSGITATTPPGERNESVDIPLLGTLDTRTTSLPVLTLFIAGLDSFNPCAFFVLLSLLGLLVHAQSRNKMLLVGGVFVFFSGLIYFFFMAAWLNLFLVMGHVTFITTIAGAVSILIAGINIKDFFFFKQGVSLTIPDSAKPKLFDRMRKLLRSTSLFSILIGTTVLAIVANSYELLCTAGFPMVFTRILTLHALSLTTYYLYLVFYNVVYIIPLLLIVLAFSITLGSRKLSERQGRLLKLVSGLMMLGLGGVLIVNPALLNNLMISFVLLAGALGISIVLDLAMRRRAY
jgi:thiol-disulfide isomerase/thioredoxin